MKIYELRLTLGETKLLYIQNFTTEEAARKRYERIYKANGNEIKTAKLATLKADEQGSFNAINIVNL